RVPREYHGGLARHEPADIVTEGPIVKTSNEGPGQLDLFSEATEPNGATPAVDPTTNSRTTAPLIPKSENKGSVGAEEGKSPPVKSKNPPRVAFYDDVSVARRKRMEPTFVVPRPPVKRIVIPDSPMIDDEPPPLPKRGRLGFVVAAAMLIGIG